jgi:DNA-binding NarL/FixJ family response regulator
VADRQTRVLVVDDHPLFRDGLTGLLATVEDVVVVGAAPSGEEAVRLCAELVPDVVLMDLTMPGMSGLEATRRIVRGHPTTAVLVLTMVDDDAAVTTALQVGARGYLLKGVVQEEVLAAVRTVADGGAVFGKGVASQLLSGGRQRYDMALSPRESEVLSLLAEGRSNAEIARELAISVKTVQNHVARILQKLQVSDRTQAALRARGW